jgi:hypothetical protein
VVGLRFYLYRELLLAEPYQGKVLGIRKGLFGSDLADVRASLNPGSLVVVSKVPDFLPSRLVEGQDLDVWVLPQRPGQAFLEEPTGLDIIGSSAVLGLSILWFFAVPFAFYLKGSVGE